MGARRGRGVSYRKRVADINRIYEQQARLGLSNREIWRRFVYPTYGLCERAFYKILYAGTCPPPPEEDLPSLFNDNDDMNGNGSDR